LGGCSASLNDPPFLFVITSGGIKRMTNKSSVKVAVVQAAPILFEREATVEKTCQLIRDVAKEGAEFVLFPEAFIPAYPRGLSFGMVVGSRTPDGRRLWQRYWDNSVEIPGPATETLSTAVRDAGVHMAIGVIEQDSEFSGGTLYCTLLYFGPDGRILGKHRKLKPTGAERLIWGEGDGSTMPVFETEFGKIGGLICWENYMPLARTFMYGKGVEIYLAPTADSRNTWQSSLQHISCEGRCFVLGCNQFVTKEMYPADLQKHDELAEQPEVMCRGGSAIVSPLGDVIAGPLFDQEGILYADLDLTEIVRAKVDFDAVGHYARPDVFQLHVNESANLPVKALHSQH
jgi:nitrilase